MANPNIVEVSDIRGKTNALQVTTSALTILENNSSSGIVVKVNSLIVSNKDAEEDRDVSVFLNRDSVDYRIASTISVPLNATLVVISKDTGIYLQEGDTLKISGSANNALDAICSYEEIG